VHDSKGLDALAIAAHKAQGKSLVDLPGSESIPLPLAVSVAAADLVVDLSSADSSTLAIALESGRKALAQGSRLIVARKDALALAGADWLSDPREIGCNAALGGTGARLLAELSELREHCRGVSLVANASSTAIIEALEEGESLADGLARARELGLLEADPELDLRGQDAALKLSIVVAAVFGRRLDPAELAKVDLRSLDPHLLRRRAARGRCTRLVAHCPREGQASLELCELPRTSALAVPRDRAAYAYELADGQLRLHVGTGLGPLPTARAVLADLQAASREVSKS
jgi:homoserine dehydrogenase